MRIHYAISSCSLGHALVASTERGVCAILLRDDPDELAADLRRRFPEAEIKPAASTESGVVATVVAFLDDPCGVLGLSLDPHGSEFQHRVWDALRTIPAGETRSYAQVAAAIGAPDASRAVASACAANPIAIAVPCHRVVRADGALSGYRWGIERKRALLERERACADGPFGARNR